MCSECEQCNTNAIKSITAFKKIKALEVEQMEIKNKATEDSDNFKIQISNINCKIDSKNKASKGDKDGRGRLIKAVLVVLVPIFAAEFGIDLSEYVKLMA